MNVIGTYGNLLMTAMMVLDVAHLIMAVSPLVLPWIEEGVNVKFDIWFLIQKLFLNNP